ncbi:MAG: cytochrome d ubiquinol oxidase subunit II [Chloroflexi bacterium]|nr:cytochrome d ubiquinol oxidase subunit II [Chloroflexota bacterium]
MDLNIIWFILIAVLFAGFFLLEGFDYGVGILLPFLGKNDDERRLIINAIGPFWDGNEVWMLTAGGAMFAAFPQWYATLFSGFYLALLLMLLALILRGVSFEYRSKDESPKWRNRWDWAIFIGSFLPALLWGVAMTNIVRGVPIDENMNFVGSFFGLLNPFALLGGLTAVAIFILHGAVFLALKVGEPVKTRAHNTAQKLWLVSVILLVLFVAMGYMTTDLFKGLGPNPGPIAVIAALALLAAGWLLREERHGWAFVMTALTIVATTFTAFIGLYPNVMPSTLNPDWSLTIYNASSSPYTLKIMTFVALIFTPIVLIYQGWTYWKFRERLTLEHEMEY